MVIKKRKIWRNSYEDGQKVCSSRKRTDVTSPATCTQLELYCIIYPGNKPYFGGFQEMIMHDIESLRDYLIADEIQRIQSLTYQEVVSELIELRSKTIEGMGLVELILSRKQCKDQRT